jgi:ribosomal protein L7/L12
MKLFISWSGDRSRLMALALRDWLPLVLYYVQPWLSEIDIEAGKRWSVEIAKQLEESNFGLICLTRENVESNWILFEAGALAKSLDKGAVVPFLFDLDFSDITGPLSQFQAKKVNKDSTFEIVQAINQSSPTPIEKGRLAQLLDALWPQLEERLISIPTKGNQATSVRSQKEILEDLVSTIRALDQRLRSMEQNSLSPTATRVSAYLQIEDDRWIQKAKELLRAGNKVGAVKIVRDATMLSLKDAKNIVESWEISPVTSA